MGFLCSAIPTRPALAVGAAIFVLGSAILLFHAADQENPELRIKNPLALGTALKLACFIAGVMLASELLRVTFGNVGVLIVAALSGVADVDAVTISMARMGGKDIDLTTTVKGILVAVAVNTISKAMLAGWAGGHKIGALVGSVSALALAFGTFAALWWVPA